MENDFTFRASRPPTARLKSLRSRQPHLAPDTTDMRSDSEGIFWFEQSHTLIVDGKRVHRGISNRERQQLKELVKSGSFSDETMRAVVIPLNDENSEAPRLRAYDWAVTNYSKGHPKAMLKKGADGSSAIVDPNLSYEGELRKHHRLLFDPFRRGTHIFFEFDGIIHRTTVGQLTFIKWCLENGVDKYVEENLADIRQHMSSATRRKRESGKKRRRELTRAPTSLVRGVLMTSFDILTDTAAEMEASKRANRNALAGDLAKELATNDTEEDADKARKLVELLTET
jgi:hypothetical protein